MAVPVVGGWVWVGRRGGGRPPRGGADGWGGSGGVWIGGVGGDKPARGSPPPSLASPARSSSPCVKGCRADGNGEGRAGAEGGRAEIAGWGR